MVTRSLPVLHTDLEWWLGIVNLDTDLTVLKCNALEHLLYGRRVVLLYPALPFTDSISAPWSLRPPAAFLTMPTTTIADGHVVLVTLLRFPKNVGLLCCRWRQRLWSMLRRRCGVRTALFHFHAL